jgi:Holliday junction resolvase RusA-like endonuclease
MATLRERKWITGGREKIAWQVDFTDAAGRRRHRQFPTHEEAERFLKGIKYGADARRTRDAVNNGYGRHMLVFTTPFPGGSTKKAGKQAIADALRKVYPGIVPSTDPIIVHVTAACPPSSSPCDVDNLLKPVLDGMAGLAYVNDTQVIEYLIRKIPSGGPRSLKVEVWAVAAFHQLPY